MLDMTGESWARITAENIITHPAISRGVIVSPRISTPVSVAKTDSRHIKIGRAHV